MGCRFGSSYCIKGVRMLNKLYVNIDLINDIPQLGAIVVESLWKIK
jgi:hypothetical protein